MYPYQKAFRSLSISQWRKIQQYCGKRKRLRTRRQFYCLQTSLQSYSPVLFPNSIPNQQTDATAYSKPPQTLFSQTQSQPNPASP